MTQPKYIVTEEVVRELVAALEPFADRANEFDDLFEGQGWWEDIDILDCYHLDEVLTVGNFRAARAAIAKVRGGTEENVG